MRQKPSVGLVLKLLAAGKPGYQGNRLRPGFVVFVSAELESRGLL
jgi:hypothetical protein